MLAYHNDPALKVKTLARLQAHYDADEIVKGQYWEGGKGCAVGCLVHGSSHALCAERFGGDEMVYRLMDTIFEGLPNGSAKEFPLRFMSAISPGADLSRVGWKFLEWLMLIKLDYIRDETVRSCLVGTAAVISPATRGDPINEAAWAAAWAAWAAWAAGYTRMADKLISLLQEA